MAAKYALSIVTLFLVPLKLCWGKLLRGSELYTPNGQWLSLRMGTGTESAESLNRCVLCVFGFFYC